MPRFLFLTALFIHLIPIIFQIWAVAKRWQELEIFLVAIYAAVIEILMTVLSIVLASKSLSLQGEQCMTPLIGLPLICLPVFVVLFVIMAIQYIVRFWQDKSN